MKRILMLVNHDVDLYTFRMELIERLLEDGHQVIISCPYGTCIDEFVAMGCEYYDIKINRHGLNPVQELTLLNTYRKLIRDVHPDIVLTFTIKPNLYGGIFCRVKNIPYIMNITGLGTAVEGSGLLQKSIIHVYRCAAKKAQCIFFQNAENMAYFERCHVSGVRSALLPGSGVNLERFSLEDYPSQERIEFAFISRIMKEKGIDQYLDAAKYIRVKYPNTVFHVCGFCEQNYEGQLTRLDEDGVIVYHGMVKDVRQVLKDVHCTVHPSSYPEGMSNVLLESLASGRPIITTGRAGCREAVDDGVTGYVVKQKDSQDLIEKIERFIALPWEVKRQMGLAGREKVEREFDRKIVVSAYLEIINQM